MELQTREPESVAFHSRLELLSCRLQALPDKPEETAENTLRALWALATGSRLSAQLAAQHSLPELDDATCVLLDELIAIRLAGTPLAHLTQRVQFCGLELATGPDALVPRRETELLARTAVSLAHDAGMDQTLTADACTGAGNVALALASQLPRARVVGADVSAAAIALAQENAHSLGLADRVRFAVGDLLDPFDAVAGSVDVLTCNPPYISSTKVTQLPAEIADHEPAVAFDGGPFGISILMRLIRDAPRVLRPGGWLAFELGAGQGPGMLRRVAATGAYCQVRGVHDDRDVIRVVVARTLPTPETARS